MTVYNPLPVGTLISSEQQVMQLAENAMDFTVNEMTTVVQAQGKKLHVMLLEIAGYLFSHANGRAWVLRHQRSVDGARRR